MKDNYYVIIPGLYDFIVYEGENFKEAVKAVDDAFSYGAKVVWYGHNEKELVLKK